MAYAIKYEQRAVAATGLDLLAGIWLLISPALLMFRDNHRATINNTVLGIVIGLLAWWRLGSLPRNVWISIVNTVLGIWVLISPWCLGFSHVRPATNNNIAIGIVVVILSIWSARATHTWWSLPEVRRRGIQDHRDNQSAP